tara:strand:+ start:1158 stop:2414 length:1257 start_codon:yes stop_codon:yes gene_type:complete
MTLPASGNQLSMNQILQEKQGGTTARTNVSLKGLSVDGTADSSGGDITGTPNGSAPYAISEFYGYSQVSFEWENDTGGLGNAPFNVADSSSSTTTQARMRFGLSYQANNHRVRMLLQKSSGQGNGVFALASYITFATYDSSNNDPDTVEAKCNWNGTFTGHVNTASASYEPNSASFGGNWTKNSYRTIGTSSSDAFTGFTLGEWKVTRGSSLGSAFYDADDATSGEDTPAWTVRAKDANGNVLDESGTRKSNTATFKLTATRSSSGGPGGGFGGDICIHEDHKIQTEAGEWLIDDVLMKDPKIWGYNTSTNQKELVDLIEIRQVVHDNLYEINDTKVTDDHILYAEDYRPVSVNPTKAKENYGKDSDEIKVGDKLMKFDGSLEDVKSINTFSGEHKTYTIKTELGNFYANGVLVDSEI